MNKSHKKILKSIIGVLFSNVATIVSGIIVGFIIPKVLTVEGYGFYKTFTLYITYTGMFSMGIIDGIVLHYGCYDYKDYNNKLFRSFFRWYLLIHAVWATALVLLAFLCNGSDYQIIIIMIAIYMVFANVVGYFQQISQITQRFKEYSIAKGLQSALKILCGLILVVIYVYTRNTVDYKIYTGLMTGEFVVIATGYIYIYRNIIFGHSYPIKETKQQVLGLAKIGIPLMIANLCSTLILTLDRQFVNILFSNVEYAVYAFAYNLLSLITVATSAVSTVLYPILKRTTVDTLEKNYSDLISAILVFVYGTLIVYFPLCQFITWFLPKYSGSLLIFRVIFPGLAICSAITVVMHNYYKTLGINTMYFRKSLLVLVISGIANTVAYLIFKTTVSISVASLATMIFWYLYVEQFFVEKYNYSRKKNFVYLLVMMCGFYAITCVHNLIISGIIYIVIYTVITVLFQKDVFSLIKRVLSGGTI